MSISTDFIRNLRQELLPQLGLCTLCDQPLREQKEILRYHTSYGEVVHEACFQTALEQETDRA